MSSPITPITSKAPGKPKAPEKPKAPGKPGKPGKPLRLILMVPLLLLADRAAAQFDGQWTQYMLNPGIYNPAVAGRNSFLDVHIAFRQQWTGVTNAPSTLGLQVGYPVRVGKQQAGIGLLMLNESIGLFKTQMFQAQFSYRFKVWGGELRAGAQGGILQQNFASGDIYIPTSDYHSTSDDAIPTGDLEGIVPDLSLGVWYDRGPWFAGVSCAHVLGGTLHLDDGEGGGSSSGSSEDEDGTQMKVSRTLYFTGGYNISFRNPLFTLQPSLMVKSDLVTVQADVSALLRVAKKYWGGLSWRPGDGLGVLAGMQFDFGLTVCYSYDIPLYGPTDGSHEVMIGYRKAIDTSRINKKQKSVRIL